MRKIRAASLNIRLWWILPALFLSACGISRRIPQDESYFCNHRVEYTPAGAKDAAAPDELLALSKLQPNRRILWIRLNLRIHTWLVPPKALDRSLIKARERCPAKNERRAARGKRPKECKSLWSWLAYTVGEPPMLMDSAKVDKAAEQMEIFLEKKGYFSCEVKPLIHCTDSTTWFWKHRRKCTVTYAVQPGEPYRYREVAYQFDDLSMSRKIPDLKADSPITAGKIFDVAALDAERDRITAFFNNAGYYELTKDYIVYDADSSVGQRQVDVTLRLKNPRMSVPERPDEWISVPHKRYFIGEVFVHTNYNPLLPNELSGDTSLFDGVVIIEGAQPFIRKQLIAYTNAMRSGDLYQKERIDLTYRRYTQLGVTRSVTVQLNPQPEADSAGVGLLDAHILLNPARKQTISFDPRVTNRSGNMGVYTNLIYRHRNLFRGAENFEARVVTGFEASQVLGQTINDAGTDQIERNFRLNTFEVGPDISLSIPRLFPLGYDRFKKSSEPRTTFHAALNYQVRPDYQRTLSQFSFGYSFVENPDKVSRFNIEVAEISVIKIRKSPDFEEFILRLNDDFLANSYRDHLITASRLVFTLNTQKTRFQRHYYYYRATLVEGAGNLLRGLFRAARQPMDDLGSYEIATIRFAQYLKTEHDFRYYFNTNPRNTFVLRAFAGIGRAGRNLSVLPFEKSFFAGGANGIRAWQARTLGPGSFRDTTAVRTFNNIGDIKLEFNFEYRFGITEMFQAAFFLDAGNIWLLRPDDVRPGADFSSSRFISELAVGAGFGLRLDFEFFLVRLDVGYPLRDPIKVPGERWAWQPKTEYNAFLSSLAPSGIAQQYRLRGVFNIGIGFPF